MPKQETITDNTPSSQPKGKVGTGISGLDDILCGGLPENRVYLVQGNPGVGKTTMALQFLLAGRDNNEAGLYITLSETEEELLAVAGSHQWSLEGLTLFELDTAADSVKADSHYTLFHPSEIELSETIKAILEVVERSDPRRVVFDSLSEMRLLARDPLRYRRQILYLKQYFTKRNTTVLFLDDCTTSGDDLQLQSIVHGVIHLHQLAPEYGSERRCLHIVKLRGVKFRGGFHDFTIELEGLRVFPRLVAAEHRAPSRSASASSGLEQLDQMVGGGLDRGTSTLFIGPSGCGKSLLGAQYAYAAAKRGERTAAFIFDERLDTYFQRARSVGIPLESFVEDKLIRLEQIDPGELAPGQFISQVREVVDRDNAQVIIIDSLNGYLNAMPAEKYLSIQLHELLTFLGQKNVLSLLVVTQAGFIGDTLQSPVDVSYLADTVLLLRYHGRDGAVHKSISALKRRSGPHERTIRELRISEKGIELGDPVLGARNVLSGTPEIAK